MARERIYRRTVVSRDKHQAKAGSGVAYIEAYTEIRRDGLRIGGSGREKAGRHHLCTDM